MDPRLIQVRNDIPMYNEVQRRLYDYLIYKTLPILKINNDEYLKGVDYVYNQAMGSGKTEAQYKRCNQFTPSEFQLIFYQIYVQDLKEFATCLIKQLKQLLTADVEFYINAVNKQIKAYKVFMYKMIKTFFHVNSYLKGKRKDIHIEGTLVFKEKYIEVIQSTLMDKVTQMLGRFKAGHNINNSILHSVIYHIGICGLQPIRDSLILQKKDQLSECYFVPRGWNPYETLYFKEKFVARLIVYIEADYSQKSLQLLKLSTPQYVEEALRLLASEERVADLFYDNDSPRRVVICSVANILANQNGRAIMDNEKTGVYSMLQCGQQDQLRKLYLLIKQSDLIPHLSMILQRYIDKEGALIIDKITPEQEKQLKKDKVSEVILKLLELKTLADEIVFKSFNNDIKLQQGRDTAFHTLINRTSRTTNFLCYYADTELRKDRDDETESRKIIQGILKIFRYIYSSDTFFKVYQKLLCLRVLSDNFKNNDMETDMISELKAEAGAGALSKISTMISDMTNSEKFYLDYIKNSESFNKHFEFKPIILTTGSWPIYNPKMGRKNVPDQLLDPVIRLNELYQSKFPGKQLNWVFSHGSAVIQVKFKAGSYVLTVGGFQLVVMVMFTEPNVSEISVEDVSKMVKTEQLNNLYSSILHLVRLKILIKDGEEGKIESSNRLRFNQDFTYKNRRKNVEKTSPQLTEEILKEREVLVDSIIVKLMKSRKVMKYNQCTTETIKMCKIFKVELSFVKRRIQALIQKDFVKRDEKDASMLVYTP